MVGCCAHFTLLLPAWERCVDPMDLALSLLILVVLAFRIEPEDHLLLSLSPLWCGSSYQQSLGPG